MKADDIIPLHVADVTYPAEHPLAGQTGPVMAFLVRHPDGLLLVDTGIGAGDPSLDQNYQPSSSKIRDAISRAGSDAAQVRLVMSSHMHFDHAGQNRAFWRVPSSVH